ncbi:TetR family transcriptional regulator [Tamaricihabitans halophyticus]|uniref:TetR family transcriptional regulator n=1 Tax=Tamaricihabitans halophyticus TaxID=1262583 RepID=A0A4R2QE35_9PSEU|nr:TetR family transcriptional regulator [Tamaricihabitans halophyticus]TCP47353.1 TetR family transcriptional regulator [Tamaricihabitans halophyticus]
MTERRKRGPADPGRRSRLVRAALAVLSRDGFDGLSYRTVAAEAEVPLGSATYYFPQIDDLIAAVVDQAAEDSLQRFSGWDEALPDTEALIEQLAELIVEQTTSGRARSVMAYELYMLGLRRPEYRARSTAWVGHLRSSLRQHMDATTADALTAAADGLQLQSLLSPEPFTREQLIATLRRAAGR